MAATARRRVDWPALPLSEAAQATMLDGCPSSDNATLLSALDDLLACDRIDTILRRAVELARERVGLKRVAIFLRDKPNGVMRGTWGTSLEGATVDEHFIAFDLCAGHEAMYERAAREGIYWTVVDNAPIVTHTPVESRVVGRGRVCCTPIRAGLEPFGMMFSDAGLTGAPVDDEMQARGALLCSLLGTALDVARRRGQSFDPERTAPRSPIVIRATQLLADNPSMTAEELGVRLRLSASRMARVFKSEMGVSLVEYRNRLRLERFATLLEGNGDNLLEAALAAGFGSYAQFHRVFSALRGTTPGSFLRARAVRLK